MNFIYESQIWDLHIHTNKCPKGSSEFVLKYKDNTKAFVSDLISLFDLECNKGLSMISFTDHNVISADVYEEFYKRKHRVQLIPGVEIDYLSDKNQKKSKHLIVYFDANETNITDLALELNAILDKTREKNDFYTIHDLLPKLSHLGYNFLISPHAFKQSEKGLDTDWKEENFTKIDTKLYMDQFFCFWESAGLTSMSKAQQFLLDFDIEQRISVVHFSDSNNFEKLTNYLNNPHQYFHSLPSYKGLALAGTDATRIRPKSQSVSQKDFSNYIGKVDFNDQTIHFSNQLNTIIGGRGSGKSVLLDSIAMTLGETISRKERSEYLLQNSVSVYDFNGKRLSNEFKIEYFSQAYVADIFNSKDFGSKLKEKFKDAFNQISEIDIAKIKASNHETFKNLLENIETIESINLKGLTNTYPKITNDGLPINIKKGNKITISKKDDVIDYVNAESSIDLHFDKLIPNQILSNEKIINLKNSVKYVIYSESKKYNETLIKNTKSLNALIDQFFKYKDNKDEISKTKKDHSEALLLKMTDLSNNYILRNALVNAILKCTYKFKKKYANYKEVNGSIDNRFIFSKELEIQTPIDYFLMCIDKHFDKTKLKQSHIENNYTNFKKIVEIFIKNPEKFIKDSSSINQLVDDIKNFNIEYNESSNIYYVDDESKIKNIKDLSPGYQTNILLEYIVYKKTDKPLLIDQPEDNVDNQTIYTQLKKWFVDMKFKRQVIVVTHDANIVINADSENVTIANQIHENEFEYKHGALEYGDILDSAATILDGGKEAVQRRLTKYES
jgi:ABC-type lipoprotein export system ATPase subunit